ncbi:MAG TPA: hypothetical protein VJ499_14975 [Flavisolibacter sp.]|nr:hypothetical protein [Flavisolibacter sp.]
MKRFLPLLIFVLSFDNLYSQTNDSTGFEAQPTSVYEVMRQLDADRLVFYYNDNWQLVKPVCGTIFRVSKLDTVLLTFTGKFVDYYSKDSTIATEGNYTNGKKEGLFSIYFPNGQLAQSGKYNNDRKTGIWEYFYENGTPRQVLDFQENEILVKEFWNEEGKKLVESGNGEWFGYATSEKFLKTSGELLNGRKNGTWKNTISFRNMTTNIEKYKEGKLISGKMISAAAGTESYKDTMYCTIERTPKFVAAEQFQMNRCYKNQKNNWEFATYPGGMNRFYSQIREKIILSGSVLVRGVIKVQMTIDKEGKMTNFQPVSNLGYEFDLIRALQTMDNWTPTKINGKPTIQPKLISFEIR